MHITIWRGESKKCGRYLAGLRPSHAALVCRMGGNDAKHQNIDFSRHVYQSIWWEKMERQLWLRDQDLTDVTDIEIRRFEVAPWLRQLGMLTCGSRTSLVSLRLMFWLMGCSNQFEFEIGICLNSFNTHTCLSVFCFARWGNVSIISYVGTCNYTCLCIDVEMHACIHVSVHTYIQLHTYI